VATKIAMAAKLAARLAKIMRKINFSIMIHAACDAGTLSQHTQASMPSHALASSSATAPFAGKAHPSGCSTSAPSISNPYNIFHLLKKESTHP